MTRILVTSTSFLDTPGLHQDTLQASGYEIVTGRGPLPAEALAALLRGCDGVICGDDDFTRTVIQTAAQDGLRAIAKYGTGTDKIDLDAARACGVIVTNCAGVNHASVAEHVYALLLSYARNIIEADRNVRAHLWRRPTGFELRGKVIGVVGTGAIGRAVVTRATAFDMRVLGFDRHPTSELHAVPGFQYVDQLTALMAACDVVSLHLPLSESTTALIDDEMIAQMKRGAILINTARGGLVDEDAIMRGLQQGQLGAYLADVLSTEPIQPNHPFTTQPHALITPHIASRTRENVVAQGMMAVENLMRSL